MPRSQSTRSLFETALHNVVSHLDYWTEDVPDNVEFRDIILEPFDALPPFFLERILQTAANENKLKKKHLQVLIDSRLSSLDLSVCRVLANSGGIGRAISYRCSTLVNLNIRGLLKIQPSTLLQIVSSLPLLQTLNLSSTMCNDKVLLQLPQTCHCLSELDVSMCKHVTHKGIDGLVNSGLKDQLPLVSVNLSETAVSSYALVKLLTLTTLQYLIHPTVLEASEEILLKSQHHDISQLQNFSWQWHPNMKCDPWDPESFPIFGTQLIDFVDCFSNITDVTIDWTEELRPDSECYVQPHHISLFAKLNSLQKINFSNVSRRSVFRDGLTPVLEANGDSITHIVLTNFNMVNTQTVGHFCPNLTHFVYHCHSNGYITDTTTLDQFPPHKQDIIDPSSSPSSFKSLSLAESTPSSLFGNLEYLWFIYNDTDTQRNSNASEMLSLLLGSSPELRHLAIKDTNDVTETALKTNTFAKLEILELNSCNSLNGDTLAGLIDLDNPLCKLDLLNCANIYRQHADDIIRNSRVHNWGLVVKWE